MGFISFITNKTIQGIGLILGAFLLFFSFRRSYIKQGERQAEARATQAAIRRIKNGNKNATNINGFSDSDINQLLNDTSSEFKK